jgi:cyclic pyranopterin phosphate synthase
LKTIHINGKKTGSMVNITHKSNTLRKAIATATVSVSDPLTMEAIRNKNVPKGDVFEFSRAAGLLAIKKTSDVIPDCHPLPVEYASITFAIQELNVIISVEVHTIYKTGVEVEAMHGASITALTMYDMLKPLDKNVTISSIRLQSKTGGKSDVKLKASEKIKCAVIVCSDSITSGRGEDRSGKAIIDKLNQFGLNVSSYKIVPDEVDTIRQMTNNYVNENYGLIILTGGTGLSPRDVTPEAIGPLLTRSIPGIMETARSYGQQRTPFAMLSRGVAGYIGKTLVLTFPGSKAAAVESMDALFPHILHVMDVAESAGHQVNSE